MAPPGCHGESRFLGVGRLGLVAEVLLSPPCDSESHTRSSAIRIVRIPRRGHQTSPIKIPSTSTQCVVGPRGVEIIHAPFPDIATEIVKSVFVGGKRADRRGEFEIINFQALVVIPDSLARWVPWPPWVVRRQLAAFGWGFLAFVRQTNSGAPLEVGQQAIVLIIGHELGLTLLGGEPKAKINPVMPTHIHNRVVRFRRIFLVGKWDVFVHTVEPVVTHSSGPNTGEGLESWNLDHRHPNTIDMRIRNRRLRHRGRLNFGPFVIQ